MKKDLYLKKSTPSRIVESPNSHTPAHVHMGVEPINYDAELFFKGKDNHKINMSQSLDPRVNRTVTTSKLPNIGNRHSNSLIDFDYSSLENSDSSDQYDETLFEEDDQLNKEKLNLSNDSSELNLSTELAGVISDPQYKYFLFISGDLILAGTLQEIELEIKNIFFGVDKELEGSISPENILILKKVDLKMGVFLDE